MLYKHTTLEVSNGITFLSLVNGEPKILNLKEMLYYYLEHQKEVITRRTRYDLEKAEEKKHIVEGLVIALANIDEVIKVIKKSTDRQDAQAKLIRSYKLSERQALAILDMRLQRLTSLEVEKLNNELVELKKLCTELKAILSSKARILDIVKTELIDVRDRYGDERATEINIDYSDINIAD